MRRFTLTATFLPSQISYVVYNFSTVQSYMDGIEKILAATHTTTAQWKFTVDTNY